MDFDQPIAIVQCLLPPVGHWLVALRTAHRRMALGDGKPKEQHMCQPAAASRPATALATPTSAVSRSSAAGTLACPTSNAGVREGYTGWREASQTLGDSLLGREGRAAASAAVASRSGHDKGKGGVATRGARGALSGACSAGESGQTRPGPWNLSRTSP